MWPQRMHLIPIPIENGVCHNLRYLLYELGEGAFEKYSDTIKWPQSMQLIRIPGIWSLSALVLLIICNRGGGIWKGF